jgi:hypothetical protein
MSADTSYSQAGTGIYFGQGNKELHVPSGAALVFDSANLSTGTLRFDIFGARAIASNDIPNTAATPPGGILTLNTAPLLKRTNAATDKSMMIQWAASSSIEIQLPSVAIPIDCDVTKAATLKIRAKMGGATDTPTITANVFPGVGGADAGTATAALSATAANLTVAIAASTLTVGDVVSVALTPGAHTTDALDLYAVWLEYTKLTS